MFCPKCGNQNPDGAAFCGSCGAPFAANQSATATSVTMLGSALTPLAGQSVKADGSMAVAAHNTGRKLIIAAAAVVVVALAAICVYFFACSAKPVYIPTTRKIYLFDETTPTLTIHYSCAEDGKLLSVTTDNSYDGSSTTNPPVDYTYGYYRPGIIKTVEWEQEAPIKQRLIQIFNEDGWMIHQTVYYDNESTPSEDVSFEYEFAADGKSAVKTERSSDGKTQQYRYVLDGNGYPIEIYSIDNKGKEILYQTVTYQKVDHPAQIVTETARLKG